MNYEIKEKSLITECFIISSMESDRVSLYLVAGNKQSKFVVQVVHANIRSELIT